MPVPWSNMAYKALHISPRSAQVSDLAVPPDRRSPCPANDADASHVLHCTALRGTSLRRPSGAARSETCAERGRAPDAARSETCAKRDLNVAQPPELLSHQG